jgi:hypothetical protein
MALFLAPRCNRARQRAFTLVELMVAITGGLFVSIIVFTIAKNSSRFYQAETRVGEATLAGIVGFDRLRADIGRAGFLSSPNIQADPRVCGKPPTVSGFPALLEKLTSIQIEQDATSASNLEQDSILLAGSYSSVDYFPMRVFLQTGSGAGPSLILNPNSLAMQRLGADPTTTPDADARQQILLTVFRVGRAVRIVDRSDRHYYGVVAGVNTATTGGEPEIQLATSPPIQTQAAGSFCGIDQCTGCVVNVVNFIRYEVAKVSASTYGPLYDDAGAAPHDDTRAELRRVELDAAGAELSGTEELVAQYAVDLKFGLLVEETSSGVKGLRTLPFGHTDIVDDFAGLPPAASAQRIRGVRVRFGVRTRDADRDTNIDSDAGLYRVGLGGSGTGPFARVRTLQADVMLNNVTSLSW